MDETLEYALVVALAAGAALAAILANRLTQLIKLPVPALMLAASAVAAHAVPGLRPPSEQLIERLVTAALVAILYAGGLGIGRRRFRTAALPIAVVGVVGTFLTVIGIAAPLHWWLGLSWFVALLVATAIAPTDPAVVFSVLGRREVEGVSGTILEGESGANDPVGIALMASLLAAGAATGGAFLRAGGEFALQLGIGAICGLVGGRLLLVFIRRVSLPNEPLYELRSLACVFLLYGLTTLAHGSGFLAVFVAGILLGDERMPYRAETARFHAVLASLAEIVAFVALGLTVDLGVLARTDVWLPGVLIGAAVAFVIRPLLLAPLLIGSGLRRGERAFVLLAGLKGAVPILLGELLRVAGVPDAERLFGIVVVVVVFSVVVQGSLIGALAKVFQVPMRTRESPGGRLDAAPAD